MLLNLQAFSFNIFGYTFSPKLIPTLLTIAIFPILISLGLWQLDRAEEKREIDQNVFDAIAKPPLKLESTNQINLDNELYRSATFKGKYDITKQFLLDNRTHKGQPGYHVFSPFLLQHDSTKKTNNIAVLINRGWIGYQGTREVIPDIRINANTVELLGTIKKIPSSITLKDTKGESTLVFKTEQIQLEDVSLVQSIQLKKIEQTLGYKLLPAIIELDKTQNDGFIREWQPYYGSIDKHNAYALQWFAMASIVLFLFIKLNIRKR